MLVGEGANLFARLLGFEPYNPMAELTVTTLRKAIEIAEEEENSIYHYYLERARLRLQTLQLGTVGSVAIDSKKRKAAATSTGGIEMQLPGRVGDSPLIGLGNFAGEWGAAVSYTHLDVYKRQPPQRGIGTHTGCDELLVGKLAVGSACGVQLSLIHI